MFPTMMLFMFATLTLNSQDPLIAWLMMEMSGFMFLVLTCTQKKSLSAMPYIIILQTIASMIMLSSLILKDYPILSEIMLMVGMMMKMGMYPFTHLMIIMFKELNWFQCIVMMTIMKVPTLMLMTMVGKAGWLMILANTLSPLILIKFTMPTGPPKEILAISSGIQSSWMINCMLVEYPIWVSYFIMYSSVVMMTLFTIKLNWPEDSLLENPENHTEPEKVMFITLILSTMGVPPTIMFIMKAKLILAVGTSLGIPAMALILSSALSLLYYPRLLMSYMTTNMPAMKKITPILKIHFFSIAILTAGLGVSLVY